MADANWTGAVALALGAVAISAGPASATIATGSVIVTPVGIDLLSLPSDTPYTFLDDQFSAVSGGGGEYALVGASSTDLVAGFFGPGNAPLVTKLPSGTTISAATFDTPNTKGGLMFSPSSISPFFAALDVVNGDNNYYGWAMFTDPPGSLIFDAYAIETTPNTPIVTPAVPEPAGLSLLALGAVGVLAIRRRKRVLN